MPLRLLCGSAPWSSWLMQASGFRGMGRALASARSGVSDREYASALTVAARTMRWPGIRSRFGCPGSNQARRRVLGVRTTLDDVRRPGGRTDRCHRRSVIRSTWRQLYSHREQRAPLRAWYIGTDQIQAQRDVHRRPLRHPTRGQPGCSVRPPSLCSDQLWGIPSAVPDMKVTSSGDPHSASSGRCRGRDRREPWCSRSPAALRNVDRHCWGDVIGSG